MAVQPGLCRTCSETTLLVFPRDGLNNENVSLFLLQQMPVFTKGDEFEPTVIEVCNLEYSLVFGQTKQKFFLSVRFCVD